MGTLTGLQPHSLLCSRVRNDMVLASITDTNHAVEIFIQYVVQAPLSSVHSVLNARSEEWKFSFRFGFSFFSMLSLILSLSRPLQRVMF